MSKDFNHINQWLTQKLDERGVSVEQLANISGLSKASLYFYMTDRRRPDEQAMAKICHALSGLMVTDLQGNQFMQEVPFEEGLRQYTPRKRGRPSGSGGGTRELTVRKK